MRTHGGPIASLTKVMTALVVLEKSKLDDTVTVSPKAMGTPGDKNGLVAGEKIKMEDLLKVMWIDSNNAAAVAIAEHAGGSEEGFVGLMNEKAGRLGLKDTEFFNPTGLDEAGGENHSTARELARLDAICSAGGAHLGDIAHAGSDFLFAGRQATAFRAQHGRAIGQYGQHLRRQDRLYDRRRTVPAPHLGEFRQTATRSSRWCSMPGTGSRKRRRWWVGSSTISVGRDAFTNSSYETKAEVCICTAGNQSCGLTLQEFWQRLQVLIPPGKEISWKTPVRRIRQERHWPLYRPADPAGPRQDDGQRFDQDRRGETR